MIGNRIMRGVAALMRRRSGLDFGRIPGFVRLDGRADLSGIALVDQPGHGIFDKIRIPQVGIAIHVGMAHGLDLVMHGLGRAETPFLERVALQNIQHLADGYPARAGRRRGKHPVPTVITLNRRHTAWAVLNQISFTEQTAAVPVGRYQRLGNRALVESRGSLDRYGFQGAGRSFCTRRSPASRGRPSRLRKTAAAAGSLRKSSVASARRSASPCSSTQPFSARSTAGRINSARGECRRFPAPTPGPPQCRARPQPDARACSGRV